MTKGPAKNGSFALVKILVIVLVPLVGGAFALSRVAHKSVITKVDTVKTDLKEDIKHNADSIDKNTEQITELKVTTERISTTLDMLVRMQELGLEAAGVPRNMIEETKEDTVTNDE